jgi:hypothetical protein
MKRHGLLLLAVASIACAKADTAVDTTAAAPATPPAPPPITAADVRGNWTVVGKNATTDSTLVTYDLAATNDTAWTVTFANGQKVPVKILSISGDSIVSHMGPYNSVLRRGVRVETHNVMRLQDGKLVGTAVATYNVKTADSVVTIKMEGTRKP